MEKAIHSRTYSIRKIAAVLVLLTLTLLFYPSVKAQAATQTTKLFTIRLMDGSSTQKVKVYEYNNGTTTYVKAVKGKRTIKVIEDATSVSAEIYGKTAYFKANYQDITNPDDFLLTATATKANFVLQGNDGAVRKFTIKLKKTPDAKASKVVSVKSSKNAFKTDGKKTKISVKVSAPAYKSTVWYTVSNSMGETVYTSSKKTGYGKTYSWKWNGKPSSKNEAGLSSAGYAPTGTYDVTAYVKYKSAGVTRTRSMEYELDLQNAFGEATLAAYTNIAGNTTWGWKMIVTGNNKVDYAAEMVCRSVLKPGMTEIQRAKALYLWCGQHFKRTGTSYKQDRFNITMNADAIKAYGVQVAAYIKSGDAVKGKKDSVGTSATSYLNALTTQQGDCYTMARLLEVLLRHAGINADIIQNAYQNGGPIANKHGWTVAYVGGAWYEIDGRWPTKDFFPSKDMRMKMFLVGEKTAKKTHPLYTSYKNTTANMAIANKLSKTDCPGRLD